MSLFRTLDALARVRLYAALQEAQDEAAALRLDYLDRLTWEDDGGPSLPEGDR